MSTIRIGRRSADPFTRMPNETARYNFGKLGPGQILSYLLSHGDGWETSEERIAEAMGVGAHAVSTSMHLLIEHGFVERTQANESGQFGPTKYLVHDRPAVFREREIRKRETRGYKKNNIKKNNIKKTTDLTILHVSDETSATPDAEGSSLTKPKRRNYTEAFDAFWKDYQRKGNKFKAAVQWGYLSADDRRHAHASLPIYFIEKPEPKFRLDAERFLRDHRWENYEDITRQEVIDLARRDDSDTETKSWTGKAAARAAKDLQLEALENGNEPKQESLVSRIAATAPKRKELT